MMSKLLVSLDINDCFVRVPADLHEEITGLSTSKVAFHSMSRTLVKLSAPVISFTDGKSSNSCDKFLRTAGLLYFHFRSV